MKLRSSFLPLLLGAALLFSAISRADVIVDTGTPSLGGGWDLGNGTSFTYPQWLAAKFELLQPTTITDVLGWMYVYRTAGLTVAIAADGGNIPGADLYSGSTVVSFNNYQSNWEGLTGLDWQLDAGTYWVKYEGAVDYYGGMDNPAPNPLGVEAFRSHYTGGWFRQDNLDLGVRINGHATASNVPEGGSSLVLFGLASLLLAAWRGRVVRCRV